MKEIKIKITIKSKIKRTTTGALGAPEPNQDQVEMARCAVPARVQRAERMLEDIGFTAGVAPLNAALTAQRAVPTRELKSHAFLRL